MMRGTHYERKTIKAKSDNIATNHLIVILPNFLYVDWMVVELEGDVFTA